MKVRDPERTLYEIASSFFAWVVIVFALGGMLVAGLGDEGVVSGEFLVLTAFLLLGFGRLYLGMRRSSTVVGEEGEPQPAPTAPRSRPAAVRRRPRAPRR